MIDVKNTQHPAKGKLLISEPFLADKNFERTVILLCEHNANGSFGLVLNQTTDLTLSDVIDDSYSEQPLFSGGPVDKNTLHFLHRLGNDVPHTVFVSEGVQWAGEFQHIKTLLNFGKQQAENIKLFIGYSGWGAGQLEQEIAQNSWYVSDADAELIFDTPPKDIWRATLRRMGGNFKVLSHYPTDPRLN